MLGTEMCAQAIAWYEPVQALMCTGTLTAAQGAVFVVMLLWLVALER